MPPEQEVPGVSDPPRVARIEPERLVDRVLAAGGPRLRLLGRLPGGEVGAALVALPSGARAVLSCWPGALGARAPVVGGIVDRLRARATRPRRTSLSWTAGRSPPSCRSWCEGVRWVTRTLGSSAHCSR